MFLVNIFLILLFVLRIWPCDSSLFFFSCYFCPGTAKVQHPLMLFLKISTVEERIKDGIIPFSLTCF